MEHIPWYAWVLLVAIVVMGLVQLAQVLRRGPQQPDPDLQARVGELEERVNRLDPR